MEEVLIVVISGSSTSHALVSWHFDVINYAKMWFRNIIKSLFLALHYFK